MKRPGGRAEFLPHDGIPLGIMQDATYRTFVERASHGEILVLYTDGVTEHERDIFVGEARLLEAVRLASATANPAAAIRAYVFGDSTPADDVAILTGNPVPSARAQQFARSTSTQPGGETEAPALRTPGSPRRFRLARGGQGRPRTTRRRHR